MADVKKLVNYTGKENGLDLKSSNLRRRPQFATEADNCDYDDQEDLTKRPGYMPAHEGDTSDLGGWAAMFHGLDDDGTADEITKMIVNKQSGAVYEIKHGTFRLEYVGGSGDKQLTARKYFDGTSYVFKILDGATEIYSRDLGDGETQIIDYNGLRTAINSVTGSTGVNAVIDDPFAGSFNAAHMENLTVDFGSDPNVSGTKDAYFRIQWELAIESETTLPADRKYSSTIVNDVLYIASSTGGSIKKYDGNRFYVAGLPKFPYDVALSSLVFNSPGMNNGYYRYAFEYEYTDNAGQVVKGQVADSGNITNITGANQQQSWLNPTVASGYVNKFAKKDTGLPDVTYSAGDTVNFPLTGGTPPFKEGDTVYWYSPVATGNPYEVIGPESAQTLQKGRVQSVSLGNVEVEVDFDGAFRDEFPDISTMAINVYRTLGEGLSSYDQIVDNYYLVGTFPTSTASTTLMIDTLSDADLQTRAQLGFLDTDAWPELPFGRYVARYRNHLLIAGVDEEADIVHFSQAGFPENFPQATNSFSVGGGQIGDSVTGIGTSEDYFLVFKDRSIYRVTGDLGTAFALDLMKVGLGCVSHYSVRELQQGRIAFLTHKGPFQCFRGQQVVPLGAASAEPEESRLAPIFFEMNQSQAYDNGIETSYRLNRATACVAPGLNRYYLHVPCFTESDYDSGEPRTFVYDFHHDTWSEWTGIRITDEIISVNSPTVQQTGLAGSGIVDVVFWIGKKDQSATKNFLIEQYKGLYDTDFNDWGSAIAWKYATHWEDFDSPSQLKKYQSVNIFSVNNEGFNLRLRQQINWDDSTDSTDVTFPIAITDTNIIVKFGEQRARSARIIMENSDINQRVKISGYELELLTPYVPSSKE